MRARPDEKGAFMRFPALHARPLSPLAICAAALVSCHGSVSVFPLSLIHI